MKWNKLYEYPKSQRSMIKGKRHYDVGNSEPEKKLPSVTTILSATQSDEKRESLAKWRERVGSTQATRITEQAAARGTSMHKYLEDYVDGKTYADLTELGQQAGTMAQEIIKKGLENRLDEVWGSEVTIYYPGLYAGATDIVGVYEGEPAIVDFKQSNKPKRKEWIGDYGLQLAAYAIGHNFVHGTNINKGVVLMCTKDFLFQEFVFEGQEFRDCAKEWLKRVGQYHEQKTAE